MKLLLIRHGEPDYTTDTLTEVGAREAGILAERIAPMDIRAYYVSPLGRARATAKPTLEKAGRQAEVLDWLREFEAPVERPDVQGVIRIPWDWLPQDWLADPRFLDPDAWKENEIFRRGGVGEAYDKITASFDALLAQYGYVRDGRLYRVTKPNTDTLAFFCHLGLSCLLMSHLFNCSPMLLWHNVAMAPSSVTTLVTEERRAGTAIFRATAIGDISHLYAKGVEPSFAARFCEVHGDGTRED
jgi:probable phosphoglycerate mutase